jgi:hypothetical protein
MTFYEVQLSGFSLFSIAQSPTHFQIYINIIQGHGNYQYKNIPFAYEHNSQCFNFKLMFFYVKTLSYKV